MVVVVVPGVVAAAAFALVEVWTGAYVIGLAARLPACLRAAGEVSARFAIERSLPPTGPAAEPVYELASGWQLAIVPAVIGMALVVVLVRRLVREAPRHPRFLTTSRLALALAAVAITVISTVAIDDGVMLWDLPGTVAWVSVLTSGAYIVVVVAGTLAGSRASAAAVMVVATTLCAAAVVTLTTVTDDRGDGEIPSGLLLGMVGFGLAALATSSTVGVALRNRFAPTAGPSHADHDAAW